MGEVENRRSLLEEEEEEDDAGDDESLGLEEKIGREGGEVEEETIAATVAELTRVSISGLERVVGACKIWRGPGRGLAGGL